jgi:hypothetical protein
MKNQINVVGIDTAIVSIDSAALDQRDALVFSIHSVGQIVNDQEAFRAATVLKDVKEFTRAIESARKDVKDPVLDVGRKIDSLAYDLTARLEQEAKRVSAALGVYQIEIRRKEDEAKRKAWHEEQRIIDETKRRLAEAEVAAKSETQYDKVAAKIESQAIGQIAQARAEVAAISIRKPDGIATRENICFEVNDIQALYEANPMFCVLTPNNAAIKAFLKAYPKAKLTGLTHWVESTSYVR